MEPKKIESMDDPRAAMNDPGIQAANRGFFKNYLKANCPKSLAVVILSVTAIFLLIGLSSHKASSVTPVALRTADLVEVCAGASHSTSYSLHALSPQQRDDLITLLGQLRARRSGKDPDEFMLTEHLFFIFAGESDDWFAIDREGYLYMESNCYALSGMEPDAIWSQTASICGAISN